MELTRRQCNVFVLMGVVMLFFWITRAITWYTNDLQESGYLAVLHLPIVLISLAIGGYLAYLGLRGRRATREATREATRQG